MVAKLVVVDVFLIPQARDCSVHVHHTISSTHMKVPTIPDIFMRAVASRQHALELALELFSALRER